MGAGKKSDGSSSYTSGVSASGGKLTSTRPKQKSTRAVKDKDNKDNDKVGRGSKIKKSAASSAASSKKGKTSEAELMSITSSMQSGLTLTSAEPRHTVHSEFDSAGTEA